MANTLGEELSGSVSNITALIVKTASKSERTRLLKQQAQIAGQLQVFVDKVVDEALPEYDAAADCISFETKFYDRGPCVREVSGGVGSGSEGGQVGVRLGSDPGFLRNSDATGHRPLLNLGLAVLSDAARSSELNSSLNVPCG